MPNGCKESEIEEVSYKIVWKQASSLSFKLSFQLSSHIVKKFLGQPTHKARNILPQ